MGKKKDPSFEELLAGTEEIVDTLESGELGLEEALKLYEKGVANLRSCTKLISTAEEKVKLLVEKSREEFALEDFDPEEEEE